MPITPPVRLGTPIRIVIAASLIAFAACGSDDDPDVATEDPVDNSSGTPEPEASTVEVTAIDYGYQGLPATVTAGTSFTLANSSDEEIHEFVAFRLPDDEDRPVSELVALPPDELLPALGGEPATVLLTPPGGDMIPAIGDGTLSEPGRYAIVCIIPTGADPAEYLEKAKTSEGPPEVEGGPPHIARGMFAELTVEAG